jgi:CRP-like cAMP-binding protein
MIDQLIKFFEQHVSLEKSETEFIRQMIPVREVKKSALLLSEGQVSTEFYFVLSGCARLFYSSEAGEKTAFFYFENNFVSSYETFT